MDNEMSEIEDLCKEFNSYKYYDDRIELSIQKVVHKTSGYLRDQFETIVINTKDIDIQTIRQKIIEARDMREKAFDDIINHNLQHIFPMGCNELYNSLKKIYNACKTDSRMQMPISIEEDDKDRCVYIIWKKNLAIFFEFADNNICINSDEFGDEDEDENGDEDEDVDENIYELIGIEFSVDETDYLIEFLCDCFKYGKVRYPKKHYVEMQIE
jgi:hypothetical protein